MSDAPERPARHPVLRIAFLVLGFALMAVSPILGPIPGPGGLPVFALGLTLVLRNSRWAKRVFARTKRRWPRFGHYADIGLRRGSAKRRRARDRAVEPR
jgi:hypothetical protein